MIWPFKRKVKEQAMPDAFEESQKPDEKPAEPAQPKADPCAKVDALAHEHEQAIDNLIADNAAKGEEIKRLNDAFRDRAKDDCECDDCSERAEAHFQRLTAKISSYLS